MSQPAVRAEGQKPAYGHGIAESVDKPGLRPGTGTARQTRYPGRAPASSPAMHLKVVRCAPGYYRVSDGSHGPEQ